MAQYTSTNPQFGSWHFHAHTFRPYTLAGVLFAAGGGGGGLGRPDESTAASVPRGDQSPGVAIGRPDAGFSPSIGRAADQG